MASKRASGYVENVGNDAKKQKPSQPSVEEIAVVSMIIDGIFYLTGINVKDGEPYYQALEAISEKHGITAVVKLTSGYVPGVSNPNTLIYPVSFETLDGVDIIVAPVADKPEAPLQNHFPAIFKFLDDALAKECRILVHCREGRSRSVAVLVAYLMYSRQMTFADAIQLIASKRPIIATKFTAMLSKFEEFLRANGHYSSPDSKVGLDVIPQFTA